MRRLLSSWALFGSAWLLGQALLDVLVRRRVDLTATAVWTAVLVPAVQALAVERLAAPLGLADFLRRARRSLRRPAVLALWALAALCLLVLWLLGRPDLAGLDVIRVLLAMGAAALFAAAAWRAPELAAARRALVTLGTLVAVTASDRVVDWLIVAPRRLLPAWPRFAALILLLLLLSILYASLFRVQSAIAATRPTAAGWLGAAAGVGALGLLASGLPWRLTSSPSVDPGSILSAVLLFAATLCLATAGLSVWREHE